jgi:hypothetical protein
MERINFHCAKKNGRSVAKPAARKGNGRKRKGPLGAVSGGHARRTMASQSGLPALHRFLHALREEKIPFLIAGMTAAVLQGVPVTTADVDFWIGTPHSEHDAVLRICHRLGGVFQTDHVVELPDGAQLHFAYSIGGLKSFAFERKRARRLRWMGHVVTVLSLEQLRRAKKSVGRPKDKVHLEYIQSALALKRRNK